MGVMDQLCNGLLDMLKSGSQRQWKRLISIDGGQELAKETGIQFGEEQSDLAAIEHWYQKPPSSFPGSYRSDCLLDISISFLLRNRGGFAVNLVKKLRQPPARGLISFTGAHRLSHLFGEIFRGYQAFIVCHRHDGHDGNAIALDNQVFFTFITLQRIRQVLAH